jgi:ankyrin repeat protein
MLTDNTKPLNKFLVYQYDLSGKTALHFAVRNNDIQMIQILLKFKSNSMKQDFLGKTPIHEAVRDTNFEVLQILITDPTMASFRYMYWHRSIYLCKER